MKIIIAFIQKIFRSTKYFSTSNIIEFILLFINNLNNFRLIELLPLILTSNELIMSRRKQSVITTFMGLLLRIQSGTFIHSIDFLTKLVTYRRTVFIHINW
jgi:hypothetical protein